METTLQRPTSIELLATVAHELRNPLAAIQGAVRSLETPNHTSLTADQARAVIGRQALRIARISDDLLSASYVSTGKIDLRREAIDARDIISAALEACQTQIDAAKHALDISLPPHPVVLCVDAARLTQVVTNLLDNAIKYSDRQSRIAISIECSVATVSIRILDHGIGIAPAFLPHVFDLFVRADQARAHSGVGMGVGLNLVKHIVERHDGWVEVFSAGPGSGTAFTVHLPRCA